MSFEASLNYELKKRINEFRSVPKLRIKQKHIKRAYQRQS